MKCANCNNDNNSWLSDEEDTIYCQKCFHRTLKSTGIDDSVKCPDCGNLRDRKAYHCRHCNNAWR